MENHKNSIASTGFREVAKMIRKTHDFEGVQNSKFKLPCKREHDFQSTIPDLIFFDLHRASGVMILMMRRTCVFYAAKRFIKTTWILTNLFSTCQSDQNCHYQPRFFIFDNAFLS